MDLSHCTIGMLTEGSEFWLPGMNAPEKCDTNQDVRWIGYDLTYINSIKDKAMNTSLKKRLSISLPLCAAVMAAGLIAPPKAEADVALATALGGAALLGTLLHSSSHYHGYPYAVGYPYAHPVVPYAYAAPVAPVVVAPYPYYRPAPAYVYYPY